MDKLKILWIGGNHPRHLYYVNTLNNAFELSGCIIVERENLLPSPPSNITKIDRENFIRHFENRAASEDKYFGDFTNKYPGCPTLSVADDLNSIKSVEFLNKINPDIVLIFGSGMIRDPLFSNLPKNTINMHLGLSPRYRGAATLFWPFYFLEPQYAGSTFHYITDQPDAGDIIHQVIPILEFGDKIHDVACKVVVDSANAAIKLIEKFQQNKKWESFKQKTSGKNFLEKDFKPAHLRLIYGTFDDRIVDAYLNKELSIKEPKICSQF